MRKAFSETLAGIAKQDSRVLLLTADLGYMALEPFAEAIPAQFFNVGVAEQNMVGVATGLAEAGFIPFVYSIVTFATLRAFEFIRNGPIAQRLPVRVVSVGGGMEYGTNGISHYGVEDVALMRSQPGMTILCPCDSAQTRAAVAATWNLPGPVYLRLGKDDRVIVPGLEGRFELGRAQLIHEGGDVLMVALGTGAVEAAAAAQTLSEKGIGCKVLAVSSLQPGPVDDIAAELGKFPFVITVETHYVTGGLGSWVSEIAAGRGIACRVVRRGFEDFPSSESGSQAYLHHRYGLSATNLVETAMRQLACL